MTCHKAYLRLISVNYLRFQSSTNMEVKAHNEYHSESAVYKGSIPRTFPTGIWKNSENGKDKGRNEVLF